MEKNNLYTRFQLVMCCMLIIACTGYAYSLHAAMPRFYHTVLAALGISSGTDVPGLNNVAAPKHVNTHFTGLPGGKKPSGASSDPGNASGTNTSATTGMLVGKGAVKPSKLLGATGLPQAYNTVPYEHNTFRSTGLSGTTGTTGDTGSTGSMSSSNPDELVLIDSHVHGADVHAVAWADQAYAAIGGAYGTNSSHQAATIRIYAYTDDALQEQAQYASDQATVLSLSWCTIGTTRYLAAAGATGADGNQVRIFSFNPSTGLTPVGEFNHGATVNAISWAPQPQGAPSTTGYLAIGGNTSSTDSMNVRLLAFDSTEQNPQTSVTQLTSVAHGAPVLCLDWYARGSGMHPWLAVGGQRSLGDALRTNARVYRVNILGSSMVQIAQDALSSDSIYTMRWFANTANGVLSAYLGVGGSLSTTCNMELVYLNPSSKKLVSVVQQIKQQNVYALDFFPGFSSAYAAIGGGDFASEDPACCYNLFISNNDIQNNANQFKDVAAIKLNSVVTAVACMTNDDGECYVLAGTTSTNSLPEIALYQATSNEPPCPFCVAPTGMSGVPGPTGPAGATGTIPAYAIRLPFRWSYMRSFAYADFSTTAYDNTNLYYTLGNRTTYFGPFSFPGSNTVNVGTVVVTYAGPNANFTAELVQIDTTTGVLESLQTQSIVGPNSTIPQTAYITITGNMPVSPSVLCFRCTKHTGMVRLYGIGLY